ncbi:MAG: GNAT family N-acetyltransferase [Anaerolineae bacterium]|nr:GNAT family N-acetyltransferase [Anaerolineae bacterium]
MEIEDIFDDLSVLETERLLLRKMILSDAEDLFEYASDPEVAKYTTWQAHESIEDTKCFLNSVMDQHKNRHVAPWGVIHKGDKKLIGTCGFVYWDLHNSRAEIAYALSRKYWRKGYMTEAVREVTTFGFRTMELNRIEARCKTENIASARVMEKAGMKFEGILRQHMFAKGTYHDLKIYSILKEEWTNNDRQTL